MWLTNFVAHNPGLCVLGYIVSFWIMVSLLILFEGMSKTGKLWALVYTAVMAIITFIYVSGYFQSLSDNLSYV